MKRVKQPLSMATATKSTTRTTTGTALATPTKLRLQEPLTARERTSSRSSLRVSLTPASSSSSSSPQRVHHPQQSSPASSSSFTLVRHTTVLKRRRMEEVRDGRHRETCPVLHLFNSSNHNSDNDDSAATEAGSRLRKHSMVLKGLRIEEVKDDRHRESCPVRHLIINSDSCSNDSATADSSSRLREQRAEGARSDTKESCLFASAFLPACRCHHSNNIDQQPTTSKIRCNSNNNDCFRIREKQGRIDSSSATSSSLTSSFSLSSPPFVEMQSSFRRRRKRKILLRFRNYYNCFLLFLLSCICLSPSVVVVVHAAPYATCVSAFVAADANANGLLEQTEFEAAMAVLSNNRLTGDSTGNAMGNAYAAQAAITTSLADPTALVPLCQGAHAAALTLLGVTMSLIFCKISLSRGDANRDDLLANDLEYSTFLNTLLRGKIAATATFDTLPAQVQAAFNDNAGDTGFVDVTGSKPGSTSTGEQDAFLGHFCYQASISGETAGAAPATTAPVAATTTVTPTDTTTTGGTVTVWNTAAYSLTLCQIDLTISDSLRDGMIDQTDYLTYASRLTKTSKVASFDLLPAALQENYNTLAAGTALGFSVAGAQPGSTRTAEEEANLNNVCGSSWIAAQNSAPAGTTTPTGQTATTSPAGGGATVAPTGLEPTLCTRYLFLSDMDRNTFLSDAEYLRFLNLAANRAYLSNTFDTLPPNLQENYNTLANGNANGIDISGSIPNSAATAEQTANLEKICLDTGIAIGVAKNGGGTTTTAPVPGPATTAPVPGPATTAPGTGTVAPTVAGIPKVFNAYIVNNVNGLTADSLKSGINRRALDDGYSAFVKAQFDAYLAKASPAATPAAGRRYLIRGASDDFSYNLTRVLQTTTSTTLVAESPINDLLVDQACPTGITGNCQKAYASFEFETDNPNPAPIVAALTAQIQAAIPATTAGLQSFVATANAAAEITVVAAADQPLRPPAAPTSAPTSIIPSSESTNDDGGEKSNAGAIAGAVIGVVLGAALVFGIAFYVKKKGCCCDVMSKKKPAGTGGGRDQNGSNKTTNDEDEENGATGSDKGNGTSFGFQTTEEENGFKKENDKDMFDDEEESENDSDREDVLDTQAQQNGAQGGNNRLGGFGFGKRKGNTGFGDDDSVGKLDAEDAFKETPTANDFADYAFDDPADDPDVKKRMKDGNESIGDIFSTNSSNASGSKAGWQNGDETKNPAIWSQENGDFNAAKEKAPSVGSESGSQSRSADDGERSGSYDEDESGSDEDSYYDDDEDDESRFTRETFGNSADPRPTVPENVRQMDAMVNQGNWDGVMAAAAKFDGTLDDDGTKSSGPSLEESEGASKSDASGSRSTRDGDGRSPAGSQVESVSYTSEDLQRRNEYRGEIEELVRKVVPDEIDNVSAMMDQFAGRESELINTLQAMEERTSQQRARKAVHKSKGMPQRDNFGFAAGGTDGSAAIAAASTLGVSQTPAGDAPRGGGGGGGAAARNAARAAAGGGFDERDEGQSFEDEASYLSGEDRSGSYVSGERSGDPDGSYVSGERSYISGEERSGSYASGKGSRSYVSGEGSRSYVSGEERSGSYVSGEGSRSYVSGEERSGSYVSGEGSRSYVSGEERSGSYVSGEGSRSYVSGEERSGSYVSGEGSRSYVSGEERSGSYVSGEGSKSYVSGEGSKSYVSGEGSKSYVSGEGSKSYVSGEGSKSYVSGEGSKSYVSGEGSKSYVSGEGSKSYVSGEGSKSYVSGEGSKSYVSGEGSHSQSYVSGEGSKSYVSGEGSKSYVSGEGSRSYVSGEGSRSHVSGEGSRSYVSGEGSRSYVSGEGSRSYVSGEGSRSYVSGEGSRSRVSGEGSYVSGEGSRSYVSGEGSRSYVSGEGSRSYVSGEGSKSYVSGEGSRSYVSGEGSRSHVSGEGSRSYASGDPDGSYVSGSHSGDPDGSYVSGSYRSGSHRSGSHRSGSHSGHPDDRRRRKGDEEGSYSDDGSRSQSGSYSDDGSRSQSGSYDDDGFG